jgi:hypothetical protein
VALVAAAIPGRGHDFFKGWLEKLAGYLLRKAAYSLILAVLLAVNGALASATSQLGWLMSFGLQALFFWAVFLQRKTLAEGLIGIATGPGAPGRDASLGLLSLYAGGRIAGRLSRPLRRGARSISGRSDRLIGGAARGAGGAADPRRAPRLGTSYSAPVGGGAPALDAPGPAKRPRPAAPSAGETETGKGAPGSLAGISASEAPAAGGVSAKGGQRRKRPSRDAPAKSEALPRDPRPEERPGRPSQREGRQPAGQPPTRKGSSAGKGEGSLGAELRAERERSREVLRKPPVGEDPPDSGRDTSPPGRKRRRRKGGGR